ncbi:hypothetical protein [Fontibacillus phaseoli]|nr:hypothetical protein [Fontibacillus phaseoli]
MYELEFGIVGTSKGSVSVWNLDALKVQIPGQHPVASEMYVLNPSFPILS